MQKLVVVVMFRELLVWAFEAKDEALQVSVAIWHKLDGLLLSFVIQALLDGHAWGEDELRCLHLQIPHCSLRVKNISLKVVAGPSLKDEVFDSVLLHPENGEVLDHPHMSLPAHIFNVEPGHEARLATLKSWGEFDGRHLLRKILKLLDLGLPAFVPRNLLLWLQFGTIRTKPGLGFGVATEGIHPLHTNLLGLKLLLEFDSALLLLKVELLEVDNGLDLADLLFFSLLRH